MLEEGALLLERARAEVPRTAAQQAVLADAVAGPARHHPPRRRARSRPAPTAPSSDELAARPLRDARHARRPTYPLLVERELALSGAWYELFPRSRGRDRTTRTEHRWTTGTLRTAAKRLPAIAAMGFDVVYLTPVHPIGHGGPQGPQQHPRRRAPRTPAAPYAIGSADGGHDAIHPDLGTFEDFDAFVAEARRLGHGGRLDLALQCSPDHPWVTTPPRVVHHPRRRHHRLRREPAEEVPGHLPAELRQRPRRHLRRGAPGRAGVDRPRRHRCSGSTTRTPSRWSSGSG